MKIIENILLISCYLRNELNFPKCLEILKKHKNSVPLDSLRIIHLYSWRSNHFSRPSPPAFNMLPHYLSSLGGVVCERLTQRYSFAHCSVTLHIIVCSHVNWGGGRLSQGTKVAAPSCISLGTVSFVCIFWGKLISWELVEDILSLKKPTRFIKVNNLNCLTLGLEVRVGMRVSSKTEEWKELLGPS